ncbi:transcriptional regulator [Oleiphilus sp. HI0009]|nr:transcriptional regulator [Oleiphilus sp. HI0009]
MAKKTIYSIVGTTLDAVSKNKGKFEKRFDRWRPSVSLVQRKDIIDVDKVVLISRTEDKGLAEELKNDIEKISPQTTCEIRYVDFINPWQLDTTYIEMRDLIANEPLNDNDDYFFHINTGSHIQQIAIFLLCESKKFRGKLLQTSPRSKEDTTKHDIQIIDLDLSKYDNIAKRFAQEKKDAKSLLKSGIKTENKAFNTLIDRIEVVAERSTEPMLITGPTGAGKSQLVKNIFKLKSQLNQVTGELIETNCATLVGDNAISTLFGHTKGAFTGASSPREGLLKRANGGILFLDEIGELDLDGQAKLLTAVESKTFLPLGADKEETSDFLLIAGTNKDLRTEVAKGRFRADLFARINLWVFSMPGLKERKEDIEPNIDYELSLIETSKTGIEFNKEAKKKYLAFATSEQGKWSSNFRDLKSSIKRLSTLCEGGRITEEDVNLEIETLMYTWGSEYNEEAEINNKNRLKKEQDKLIYLCIETDLINEMDYIEKIEVEEILRVCSQSKSAAEASRFLFNKSRNKKSKKNDSQRLIEKLKKYGIRFLDVPKEIRQ